MGLLDTAYDELRKPRALGLRVGDFVPYVSGLLAADDARLAAQQGNYGEAAGALAGFIPGGAIVKKLTGVNLGSVSPRQIFAGAKAKGADLEALKRAESRLSAGDDPRKVWGEEGWFRGPDGKMRWEIDDRGADVLSYGSGKMDISTIHPEFRKAYGLVPRSIQDDIPGSAAVGKTKSGETILVYNPKSQTKTSSAVHELQHVAQETEGFAQGGSPRDFQNQTAVEAVFPVIKWREEVERLSANKGIPLSKASEILESDYRGAGLDEMIPRASLRSLALSDSMSQGAKLRETMSKQAQEYGLRNRTKAYSPFEMYQRLAGESEARLAESRRTMSPEERRANYPEYEFANELVFRGMLD